MYLSYFPTPRPDEPLYSIFARYHNALGYSSYSHTLLDLFGRKFISTSLDLPTHLNLLLERIEWTGLTQELLIVEHTALPYYSFMLDYEVYKSAVLAGCSDQSANVDARLGLRTTRVLLPEYFRCCQSCIEDDRNTYGSAYWRRVHQLPGVVVCPNHRQVLVDTAVKRIRRKSRYQLITLEDALDQCGVIKSTATRNDPAMVELAVDALRLLDSPLDISLDFAIEIIRTRLRMIGWASRSGRLRCKSFRTAWQDRYPLEIREYLRCGISTLEDPVSILRRVLSNKHGRPHPLLVTMFLRVMGMPVIDLLRETIAVQNRAIKPPVILGQASCKNPVCPAFNTTTYISSKLSEQDSECFVATCRCCGAIYKSTTNNLHHVQVLSRGHLWNEKLIELIRNECSSLRSIARTLKVDPMTVKRCAEALKLCTPWIKPPVSKVSDNQSIQDIKQHKRSDWLKFCQVNPESTGTELRKMNPALWTWLYRNDHEWLQNNKPALTKPVNKKVRKDWSEVDQQLTLRLETCVEQILNSPEKPVQVTKAELARQLGMTQLFSSKVITKLPRLKTRSTALLDTRESFARRRICWAADKLRRDGVQAQYWQLVRAAGLRPDMEAACADEVQKQLGNGRD
jgi:hypothetical protein